MKNTVHIQTERLFYAIDFNLVLLEKEFVQKPVTSG
jgi:hypothetical protein